MTPFAIELRRQLDETGISQNALARRARLDKGMISRLLHGTRTPSRETVAAIASVLAPGEMGGAADRRIALFLAAGYVPEGYVVTQMERIETEAVA